MGIFSFLTKQFIDVIEWVEPGDGILAYQYPMQDREIQNGAKLTVRESQLAVFVNEGKFADEFAPGLYTLTTQTLPILTNLQNWDKAFASPFKSEVYFFSTREQLDQRWGTATPLTIRDREFGPIRVQSHGLFSYQLTDPKKFYLKVSGTRELYRAEELAGQLRGSILTTMASTLGGGEINFVDMAANAQTLSDTVKSALQGSFADYGLTVRTFQIQSFSLPEEVQKRLDERAGMGIVGNLSQYTQFQAAQSIPIAAANEGGMAGIGAGLGAGAALANTLTQAMMPSAQSPQAHTAQAGSPAVGEEDPFVTIERLHQLHTKGILSAEEFEAKKTLLLDKIK